MGEATRAATLGGLAADFIDLMQSGSGRLASALMQGVRLGDEGRQWVRRHGRRVWEGDRRLHVAVREAPAELQPELARRLQQALEAVEGVAWARFHPVLRHVVIALDQPDLPAHARRLLTEDVIAVIAGVESALELEAAPLAARSPPEQHPGDALPLLLTTLEGGIDLLSGAAGLALRRLGLPTPGIVLELMAALGPVADVPALRKGVERRLSIPVTDIWLELAEATLRPLLRSDLGSLAGLAHRGLQMAELRARRDVWRQWEALLCADADQMDPLPLSPPPARPRPLPQSRLERNALHFSVGTLSAFVAIWLASGRLEPATAAVFAGLPRPARLGREAFAARLGYRLARAGVLVRDPHVLRRLDRLDCVALDCALLDAHAAELVALARSLRHQPLRLVWVGSHAAAPPVGDHRLRTRPARAIRRLQREGWAVAFVSAGDHEGMAVADCGIGLSEADSPPPAGAHILIPPDLAYARTVLGAIDEARRAAQESVTLSGAKVALAAALAARGVDRPVTRRILSASGLMSLIALADGVRLANHLTVPAQRAPFSGYALRPWHRLETAQVLEALGSGEAGLTEEQALQRRQPRQRRRSPVVTLALLTAEELQGPLAPVLTFASALSWLGGARTDALLITAVMGFNAAFGSLQRSRAEALIADLSTRTQQTVAVRRPGGSPRSVPVADLVPGDVIELAAGDAVPADCRILGATDLEADEAALTGESMPVAKEAPACAGDSFAERTSMLHAGTYVVSGSVRAVITAVGPDTEAGRAEQEATQGLTRHSGVEQRLRLLTERTVPVAVGAAGVLALTGRIRGIALTDMLATGVSLAVAAVPEGLPVLARLAQSSAAARLSRRGTVVRDVGAIEALGRMDVLCADKTGTLTDGCLSLRRVSDGEGVADADQLGPSHRHVLRVALRASPSRTRGDPTPHATDRALMLAAEHAGIASHAGTSRWTRLDDLPFEPGRAYQAGLARLDGEMLISVKGAPEVLLPRCTHRGEGERRQALDAAGRARLLEHARHLAGNGYRVLAVAERHAHEQRPVDGGRVADLAFIGLLAFADPPRAAAAVAVSRLRRAGIAVVMLTGDHPDTAAAIASELGLADGGHVMTGPGIDASSDDELARAIGEVRVFARVTPVHKVRIVRALQRAGHVVGMTGDGANDAQAIRLADVGIALGAQSTAAARAAADMVVTDGRIETIVEAVLEGRGLWRSLGDAIALLVGGNLGEILFTLLAALPSGRSPLNPRQLLLLNLISDSVPGLALALRQPRAGAGDAMAAPLEVQLGERLNRDIARRAGVTAGAAALAWGAALLRPGRRDAGTVALAALTGAQLGQTLVDGRGDLTVTTSSLGAVAALLGAVQVPVLSRLFGSRPLGPTGLMLATGATIGAALMHALLQAGAPLPGNHAADNPPTSTGAAMNEGTRGSRPDNDELAAVRSRLMQNPGAVSELIRFTPALEEGEVRGYRIDPGPSPGLFYRLDLRPGDVVTHVNDTPATPTHFATLLRLAMESAAFRIRLLRDGQAVTLRFSL